MADVYDIHYQPVPEAEVTGFKSFTFGFRAALKVRGPQALVNRWAKTFMTPKGSDPLDLSMGTTFASLIGNNISNVTTELEDVVNISIEDANTQVKAQDTAAFYSDDQRLQSATLLTFNINGDSIILWVEIRNMAGDVLPVRLVDLANR